MLEEGSPRRREKSFSTTDLAELLVTLSQVGANLGEDRLAVVQAVLGFLVRSLEGRPFPCCLGLLCTHGIAKLRQLHPRPPSIHQRVGTQGARQPL